MAFSEITISTTDLKDFRKEVERMERAVGRKKVNSAMTRNARPMLRKMKDGSPSVRIAKMTAITTRQRKRPTAPPIGVRVGVINNNANDFPDFSAPALASVLEHGTRERFRSAAKSFGFSIGVQSTGKVTGHPWIRPAYDSSEGKFIADMMQTFNNIV